MKHASSQASAARRRLRGARLLAGVALLLLATVLGACGSSSSDGGGGAEVDLSVTSPPAKSDLNEVTWALNVEPTTLDPIYSYNFYDSQVLSNMCESLFRLNPDLTISPLLATGAENPSPTRWVYQIRKGVEFWDGTPLTAADVVYSLRRNLDPQLGSYFVDYYRNVADIRQTGPYEVTVELTQPDALWNPTLVVAGSAIIEKEWGTENAGKIGSAGAGLMCTGPYELASWSRGSSITLEPNPGYWDSNRQPRVAKMVFRALEEPAAQTQALVSGDAEGMFLVDPSGLPALAQSGGKTYFGRSLKLDYLVPTRVPSPLADADVRKAVALLVDRPAIVESIYNGAAEPMRTLVTPTVWGEDPAVREVYEPEWNAVKEYATQNIPMAAKLFEAAGSPREPITVAFPRGGAEQQVVEAVQSAAREIGLNLELKGYTLAGMVNLYYDQEAQAEAGIDMVYAPFNVDVTDPFGLYQIFNPRIESVYNYSGWSNPKVTTLLERAQRTYDPVKRAETTAAAERIVIDEMPMIPLVSANVMAYMNDRVTGSPTSFSVYWSAWANGLGGTEG